MPISLVGDIVDFFDLPERLVKNIVVVERDACNAILNTVASKRPQFGGVKLPCLGFFKALYKGLLDVRQQQVKLFVGRLLEVIRHTAIEACHQTLDIDFAVGVSGEFQLKDTARPREPFLRVQQGSWMGTGPSTR